MWGVTLCDLGQVTFVDKSPRRSKVIEGVMGYSSYETLTGGEE